MRRVCAAFALLALLSSGRLAFAQGATKHTFFNLNPTTFTFVATDPAGTVFQVQFPANPGDFLRRNPDGTYFVQGASGSAEITVTPQGFPFPAFAGVTTFHVSGTVEATPLGEGRFDWSSDGRRANVEGVGLLVNVLDGSLWDLSAQVVQRDGVFKVFQVTITPH